MIEFKIYDKKGKVAKVLKAEFRSIRTGTAKRLFKAVEPEKMAGLKTAGELSEYLTRKSVALYPVFEQILLEVFDGLTQQDLDEGTEIAEVAEVIGTLLALTIARLSTVGDHVKKVLGAGGMEAGQPL